MSFFYVLPRIVPSANFFPPSAELLTEFRRRKWLLFFFSSIQMSSPAPSPPKNSPVWNEDVIFVLILQSFSSQFSLRHFSVWMSVMIRPQLGLFFVRIFSTGVWWQRHDALRHDALRRTTFLRISSFSASCHEQCCYYKKQKHITSSVYDCTVEDVENA